MKINDQIFNSPVSASAEIPQNRVLSPEGSNMKAGERLFERLGQFTAHAFLLSVVALGLPGTVGAADVTVNCDDPPSADFGSISDALSALDLEGPHTISVAPGTCNENVVIDKRERLTIEAPDGVDIVSLDPEGTVIHIRDSRSIVLRSLSAYGAEIGFDIVASSAVRLEGNRSIGNTGFGYLIVDQSSVYFFSHALDNGRVGVLVTRDSYVAVEEAEVTGNGRAGIVCREGSMCHLAGNVVIEDNLDIGLAAVNNSLIRVESIHGPNTIQSNASGILVLGNSIVTLTGANGNLVNANNGPGIEVETNSSLTLVNSTVTNNSGPGVSVRRNSVAGILDGFDSSNTISTNIGANLACDSTSLIHGNLTGIPGIDCNRIEREMGPPRPGIVN